MEACLQIILIPFFVLWLLIEPSTVWGGFLNADQIGRIDALFKRARRYRLTDDTYDFIGLLYCVDRQ